MGGPVAWRPTTIAFIPSYLFREFLFSARGAFAYFLQLMVCFCCLSIGLWAVVNTAGLCCRGRLDQQDHGLWEALYRHNVLAALRASRAFLPLLKHKQGKPITSFFLPRQDIPRDYPPYSFNKPFLTDNSGKALFQNAPEISTYALVIGKKFSLEIHFLFTF